MDTTDDIAVSAAVDKIEITPEAQNYVLLLLVVFNIDQKQHQNVRP